jgi:hypothetical protein
VVRHRLARPLYEAMPAIADDGTTLHLLRSSCIASRLAGALRSSPAAFMAKTNAKVWEWGSGRAMTSS